MNVAVPYKSELHQKLLHALIARYTAATTEQSKHLTKWDDAERLCKAYLPESTLDSIRRTSRRNAGTQSYRTIEVPYSYAILLAAHMYLTTVFLARSPVFQFSGRHGESELQVQGVEAVHDYQLQVGGGMVPLYLWLLDALKYGEGILGLYWDEELVTVSRIVEKTPSFFGLPVAGKPRKVRETLQARGYVGNRLYNVRPHDFLWDPRVPLYRLQDGNFCGRVVDVGWNDILRKEQSGHYMNIDALRQHRRTLSERINGGPTEDLPAQNTAQYIDDYDQGFVSLIEFYVELSPKEWGLGSSSAPEKWVFVLADKQVIIAARPFGAFHDKFPFFVLEPEFEAYNVTKSGLIEQTKDLNYTLSWLFNSHFYNIRQVLNNQLVVDPSRIEMSDLRNADGGFLLRLRPSAYGSDVRTAIQQLPVADVTAQHVGNAQVVAEMMQRITGVTDNIMGMLNPRGRKTATEVRTSSTFGVNRLKTMAEYMSAMGFTPLAQVMVQQTQQFHDFEQVYRIVGRGGPVDFVHVSPETIMGFFDYVPIDGTMPVDRFAQATLWADLMKQMQSNPQLAQQYDFGRIFSHIAKLMGVKSLEEFRVQVRPDAELLQGAQNGNAIPLGTASQSRGPSGGSEETAGRPPQPGQLAGLGPVA